MVMLARGLRRSWLTMASTSLAAAIPSPAPNIDTALWLAMVPSATASHFGRQRAGRGALTQRSCFEKPPRMTKKPRRSSAALHCRRPVSPTWRTMRPPQVSAVIVLAAALLGAAPEARALPTIAEYARAFEKRDGMFPLYWDAEKGRLLIE